MRKEVSVLAGNRSVAQRLRKGALRQAGGTEHLLDIGIAVTQAVELAGGGERRLERLTKILLRPFELEIAGGIC